MPGRGENRLLAVFSGPEVPLQHTAQPPDDCHAYVLLFANFLFLSDLLQAGRAARSPATAAMVDRLRLYFWRGRYGVGGNG